MGLRIPVETVEEVGEEAKPADFSTVFPQPEIAKSRKFLYNLGSLPLFYRLYEYGCLNTSFIRQER
jgi:hypothetical protein